MPAPLGSSRTRGRRRSSGPGWLRLARSRRLLRGFRRPRCSSGPPRSGRLRDAGAAGPKRAAWEQARAAAVAAARRARAPGGPSASGRAPRSSSPPAIRTTEPGACSARPAATLAGVAASASRMTSQPSTTPRRSRRSARPCQPDSASAIASGEAPASSALAPASRPDSGPGAGGSAAAGPRSWARPSSRTTRRSDSMPAPGSQAGPRSVQRRIRAGESAASSTAPGIVGVHDRPVVLPPGTRRCGAWPRDRRRGCRAGRRGRPRRS